jgi:hypothetical protein
MLIFRKLPAVTPPLIGAICGAAVLGLFGLLTMLFSLVNPAVQAQESQTSAASLYTQGTGSTFDPKNIAPLAQRNSPWELTNPQPLPDEVLKKSTGPLVWVKIPKGFAGVWETRKKLIQEIGRSPWENSMPLSPSEIADYVKQDRLIDSTDQVAWLSDAYTPNGRNPSVGRDNRSLWMLNDQYFFIRGMQIDDEGNIWDCPSLRNIEFHKEFRTPFHTITKTFFVSDRKQSMVSDKELAEESTINVGDYLREWNFGLDREKIRAERHLINDTFVDARFFRTSDYDLHDVIEYIPEQKVANFKPIDNWRGIDLKESFNAFRKRTALAP